MAVVDLKGSRIMTGLDSVPAVLADPGEGGGRLRYWCDTVECNSDDSANSTYLLAKIPSNARISGLSTLYFDDLASSGSPTLDIGVFPVRTGDFTGDDDALNDGIGVSAAAGSAKVVKDIVNYGKQVWEFINGQTSDPRCDVYIKLTLKDAAVNAAGTMTLELVYSHD